MLDRCHFFLDTTRVHIRRTFTMFILFCSWHHCGPYCTMQEPSYFWGGWGNQCSISLVLMGLCESRYFANFFIPMKIHPNINVVLGWMVMAWVYIDYLIYTDMCN